MHNLPYGQLGGGTTNGGGGLGVYGDDVPISSIPSKIFPPFSVEFNAFCSPSQ